MLIVIGVLALQGLYSKIWTSSHARIILLLMLSLSFVIYQFYSTSIVGSLLAPAPRTITTIEKLTETTLKIVMEDNPSNRVIFKVSYGSDLMDLYEKKVKEQEVFVSIENGIEMIRDGRHVFLTNIDESYAYIKQLFSHSEIEQLQEIAFFPQDKIRSTLYIPIQKKIALQ